MKASFLIAGFSLVLMFFSSQGQAQTTLEEYNYATKGYRVQIESGLDMKKGYTFEEINSIRLSYTTGGFRETEFKALFKEGTKKPAAILCIYSCSDNPSKEYLCIPQPNSPRELWDSTYAKIATFEGENATALMWGLAKLSSYYGMK
ncbi:MAG TPA: hypothetical protein DGH68_01545 [Bacteroidetes bacterium]|jgi:hypothetical protein|nr:hypothetical protein [Bacteroidota bacterium]